MKRSLTRRAALVRLSAVSSSVVLLGACTQTAPAVPTAAPVKSSAPAPSTGAAPAQSSTTAQSSTPAKAPPAPAASPGAAAKSNLPAPASTAEWSQIVEAAKREGALVLMGPPGDAPRRVLMEGFNSKYPEIRVDYTSGTGPQIAPKIINELSAGQHLADLFVNSTNVALGAFRSANALEPVPPFLVGPDIQPEKWIGGQLEWADEARQLNLVFATTVKAPFAYNTDQIQPSEFKAWKDLLNPKWKGKISMWDPTVSGAGQANSIMIYSTPSLGKDVLREIIQSVSVFTRDPAQQVNWMSRGEYPIALAASDQLIFEFIGRGIKNIALFPAEDIAEGNYLTPGFSSVGIVRRPPHPNAIKVFLNYLMNREAQLEWVKATGYPTRRTDVDQSFLPPAVIPKTGGKEHQKNYDELRVGLTEEVVAFIKPFMPG